MVGVGILSAATLAEECSRSISSLLGDGVHLYVVGRFEKATGDAGWGIVFLHVAAGDICSMGVTSMDLHLFSRAEGAISNNTAELEGMACLVLLDHSQLPFQHVLR